MNRKNRLLALIISLAFCLFAATATTAFALGEEDTGADTTPVETETYAPPTETTTTPVETVAPTTTQPKTQAPVTYAPETQAPQTTQPTTYYYDTTPYEQDTQSYQERETNTSNDKAETAAVYDAEDDDVSKATMKKGDWAKIAAQLKSGNGDSADDFAFIRNNDANGGNNGEWMLILGIILEVIGLGIVGVLIFFKMKTDRAVKAGNFGKHGGNPSGNGGRADNRRPAPRQAQPNDRARRASDSGSSKKSSKFDTADVVVPKHARDPRGYKH